MSKHKAHRQPRKWPPALTASIISLTADRHIVDRRRAKLLIIVYSAFDWPNKDESRHRHDDFEARRHSRGLPMKAFIGLLMAA